MRTQADIERDIMELNSKYELLKQELLTLRKAAHATVEVWTYKLLTKLDPDPVAKFKVTKMSLKLYGKDQVIDAAGSVRVVHHSLSKEPSTQLCFSSEKLAIQGCIAAYRKMMAEYEATLTSYKELQSRLTALGG